MNTRRKFLLSGGMATTALLTAKPFKSLAGIMNPLAGVSFDEKKLLLIHTADHNDITYSELVNDIRNLKNGSSNLMLVHAGENNQAITGSLKYDAACTAGECVSAATSNYRILHKGNIKIGLITAISGKKETAKNINTTAAYLKNEKNCQLVICLSQLGFKNKTSLDDQKLAARSSHLDIIISGKADNHPVLPVIAQNKHKAEVIIHSDSGKGFSFGNIEIAFDEMKNKNFIAINALTKRREQTA